MVIRLIATGVACLLIAGCSSVIAPPAASLPGRPALGPHDALVLLSGGGSPTSNQYSQYLQAKALSGFLQRNYPADAVWTFFGIGNRPGVPADLADVHRKVKHEGLLLSTWLPGEIPRNRPARRQEVLDALRREILPRVAPGGTLYLLVGDHGTLTRGRPTGQSAITLWQVERTPSGGWKPNPAEELTVSDLQAALTEGLGQGRVVFVMTQCHSGGFHYVGTPRVFTPHPEWLRTAEAGGPSAVEAWRRQLRGLPVAGFTATDEASLAAGCTPDPDPDRWAGYERYVPEFLLGFDLLAPENARPALPSFAQVHEAATLVDGTIDKPLATSDQFLLTLAEWVEQTPADTLKPALHAAQATYHRRLDGEPFAPADPALRARQEQFARFTQSLVERHPAMKRLLEQGTRAELTAAMGPASSRPGRPRGRRTSAASPAQTLWSDIIRPAWSAALDTGEVPGLSPDAVAFETFLLERESKGQDYTSPSRASALLEWTYWRSSYAFPQRFDPVKAEAVTRWSIERRWRIGEWAKSSPDAKVREAAATWAPRVRPGLPPPPRPPNPAAINRTAAERVLIYRRVLAAWDWVLQVNDPDLRARLSALVALEQTPLPRPALP